jgi:copper resistance protein D
MINSWLAAARAAHLAACLLMFGLCVFDRLITRHLAWPPIRRWLTWIVLPLALISGAAWLALVTIDMSGSIDGLSIVWHQTTFGRIWQLRLCLWLALCVAASVSRWTALILSALLLASLAWAGHGQIGRPTTLHLAADAIHLLTAGCWPAGLLPFGLLLTRLRHTDRAAIPNITHRFSVMAVACVTLLTLTGLANSCYLLSRPSDLLWTTYGRVLMVKVILFILTVSLGAMNILHLKPRLTPTPREAAEKLQRNLWTEVVLVIGIICVVAVLGLLPPARQ